jgi:hypothetical protein
MMCVSEVDVYGDEKKECECDCGEEREVKK